MSDKEYKSPRDSEISFYEMKPGETHKTHKERIAKYEADALKALVNDPSRRGCRVHDNGDRKARQEEVTAYHASLPTQDSGSLIGYVIKHPIKSLGVAAVGLALIAAGTCAIKEGFNREARIEDGKALELKLSRPKELNDLYESESWKNGGRE